MTFIDVILPAFNAEKTLACAIESVLAQDGLNTIIVVNDASTDATASILDRFAAKDERVIAIHMPENIGPSGARNAAFRRHSAEWVALIDADDWMEDGRLRRLLDYANAHDADFVADDLILSPGGDGMSSRLWSDETFEPFEISAGDFAKYNIEQLTGSERELGYVKPLMRSELLLKLEYIWHPELRLSEDYELYLRSIIAGAKFLFVPSQGYHYNRGTASRAFRPNDLNTLISLERGFARSSDDPYAAHWLRAHADMLEAMIIWVDIFGNRSFSNFPAHLLRILQRKGIRRPIFIRLWRRFRGKDPGGRHERTL